MEEEINYSELIHGTIYRTTKIHKWSDFNNNYSIELIPENINIMFRSFQPYGFDPKSKLALFVRLDNKMTICLKVSTKEAILYLSPAVQQKTPEQIMA